MRKAACAAWKAVTGRTGGIKRTLAGALLVLAGLGAISAATPKPGPQAMPSAMPIDVVASPIESFARLNGAARRFGALEFRGGLTLSSDNEHFGGWSGLTLDADGRRLLAVSDAGSWMTGELVYRNGRPSGIRGARIGPVTALSGASLRRGRDRDAEGVRLLSGTLARGTVLVSFERNARIGVFGVSTAGLTAPKRYLKRSPDWRRMRLNRGLEAVTALAGGPMKGSILALAENMRAPDGNHMGWIWRGGTDGAPEALRVRRSGDFDLTDVVSLDDGALVLLERSFAWTRGIRMRLRLVRAETVRPGAVLDGPVLLEADMSNTIDNMEGLAVHKSGGDTILTLISDDNFNPFLQRTILLQFALAPDRLAALTR